jgi:hypothetical protein
MLAGKGMCGRTLETTHEEKPPVFAAALEALTLFEAESGRFIGSNFAEASLRVSRLPPAASFPTLFRNEPPDFLLCREREI